MRKLILLACIASFTGNAMAQDTTSLTTTTITTTTSTENKVKQKVDLRERSGDHLMVQLANNFWLNAPDSMKDHMKGFSRSANVFFMLDKPFKTNPRMSVAFGLGISTASMYTKNMEFGIDKNTPKLPIYMTDSMNHYKKYKLTNVYAEVPLELRFTAHPETPTKGFKMAIGARVGTLLSAGTKGKNLQNRAGNVISNTTYKVKDQEYFNKTRLGVSARFGYGIVSIFGTYYFSTFFKDGVAPPVKNMQIGIMLSGL